MGDADSHERDLRERIARFMQAETPAEPEQTSEDDARTLRFAAGNLDRLLSEIREYDRSKQTREEDLRVLKAAAGKLDRLLKQSAEAAATAEPKQLRRKNRPTE